MAGFSGARYLILLIVFGTLVAFFLAGLEQSHDRSSTLAERVGSNGFATIMKTWASAVAQTAAVLGVVSMILIQSVKPVFREHFHKRAVRRWLLFDESGLWELRQVRDHDDISSDRGYDDLLNLIAPSYRSDVLALPVEQLSAQIASAAEVALANPTHFHALALLSGAERYQDVRRYAEFFREASSRPDDATSSSASWVQFRNELSHHVQRRIDGWQIHTASRWKTALRLTAIVLSASLALFGVFVSGSLFIQPYTSYTFVLTVGLAGGLLASIARDLVAIVEKYRI